MASINKVILVGNLGRDPEMRYTPDGAAICNISIATTSSWKDRNSGEKKEETEWHRVVLYNRLGEVAGQYLKKGSSVYIEGRLKTRKWQDKETGQDRYATDIVADQMQMLGGRSSGASYDEPGYDDGGFSNMPSSAPAPAARPAARSTPPAAVPPSFANLDDDIPF